MINLSDFHDNIAYGVILDKTAVIILWITLMVIVVSFAIFLYWFSILLHIYLTTPHLRDTARYVLLIHMLITDTSQLLVSLFLFFCNFFLFYLPVVLCYAFSIFSYSAYRVTPYLLAVMSIERYIAICNPLRHSETCTIHWCNSMIAVMWVLGFLPVVADFIAMNFSINSDFYSLYVTCSWIFFQMNQAQNILRLSVISISFTVVGLIIFYTYIKVMLVARKMGSDTFSASKAGKTVLLHALQFFLCTMSYLNYIPITYLKKNYPYVPAINFLLFVCIPRFLSPLIYGMRDEVFSKCFKYSCTFKYLHFRTIKLVSVGPLHVGV